MGTQEYLLDKAKKEGIEKGIQTGMEKGKIQGKIEILKDLGYSIVDVCKKLSLTEEQVKPYYAGA